jgi:hypothetical protein
VPLNTGVVGGIVTYVPLRLPADLSFADFYSRVCAKMDLDPAAAELAYKITGDLVRAPAFRLNYEGDYNEAMRKMREKTRRARTREVVLTIQNMVCGVWD